MPPIATKAKQTRDSILRWIEQGRFQPGEQMPSEQAMAAELGVNHQTVRRGLSLLVDEGWIVKQPRVGNFVRDVNQPNDPAVLRIAVVFPWMFLDANNASPTRDVMLDGVAQALDRNACSVTTLSYHPEQFWEQVGMIATTQGLRGILLHGHRLLAVEHLRRLQSLGIHVIQLNRHRHLLGPDLPMFTVDRGAALEQILEGLYQQGHRRVVVVRYRSAGQGRTDTHRLLQSHARRLGLSDAESLSLYLPNETGIVDYEQLNRLFDWQPQPTAVVVPDEVVAGEMFRRCYARRIWIPEQLSIAACQDMTPAAHPVPLTAPNSVQIARYQARMAAAHLQQLILGQPSDTPVGVEVQITSQVNWTESVRTVKDG